MTVYDAIELNMLAQLQQMLELKRSQGQQGVIPQAQGVQGGQNAVPLMHAPHTEGVSEEAPSFHQAYPLDGTEYVVNTADEDRADLAEMAQVEAKGETPIPWEAVKAEIAPVPSDIEVARAITVYSQKAGVPKARELIESFGVKNAMAVPDERRAEFIAATVAHVEGL